MAGKRFIFVTAGMVLGLCANAYAALTFSFSPNAGTPQNVCDGFAAAGAMWSAAISDNVTVNLTIDYQALGAGILGSASSSSQSFTYTAVRDALIADAVSANDILSSSSLPGGNSIDMMINYTSNSPFGNGSATPYLDNDGDANNTTINMTIANAKALGLIAGNNPVSSGIITFSSNYAWDFDRSDGITPGTFDFVGVAAHELGHILGFTSGVDILDINSPNAGTYYADNAFTYVKPMDLFRFSATSLAQGSGVIDWTANTTDKYFSIDGGTTSIARFATGVNHGDGRQASHWKDDLGIGIMDPTTASGELVAISNNDLMLLDVIGWDLSGGSPPIPEPSCLGAIGVLSLVVRFTGRRIPRLRVRKAGR